MVEFDENDQSAEVGSQIIENLQLMRNSEQFKSHNNEFNEENDDNKECNNVINFCVEFNLINFFCVFLYSSQETNSLSEFQF